MVDYFSNICSISFAFVFNIHRSTIPLKTKAARGLKIIPAKILGQHPVFTVEEENLFTADAIASPSYDFPLITSDLRCVVKTYFDRTGKKVRLFQSGNFPVEYWALFLMKRYETILNKRPKISVTTG